MTYDLKQAMRYGENPQQDADYVKALPTDYSIASAKQLNEELSFNNIRDADAAVVAFVTKAVQLLWL